VLAGFGDALQALAVAGEDLDAELFLEFDDRLGDAGCEVWSALAASVRFRLRRTAS